MLDNTGGVEFQSSFTHSCLHMNNEKCPFISALRFHSTPFLKIEEVSKLSLTHLANSLE